MKNLRLFSKLLPPLLFLISACSPKYTLTTHTPTAQNPSIIMFEELYKQGYELPEMMGQVFDTAHIVTARVHTSKVEELDYHVARTQKQARETADRAIEMYLAHPTSKNFFWMQFHNTYFPTHNITVNRK